MVVRRQAGPQKGNGRTVILPLPNLYLWLVTTNRALLTQGANLEGVLCGFSTA